MSLLKILQYSTYIGDPDKEDSTSPTQRNSLRIRRSACSRNRTLEARSGGRTFIMALQSQPITNYCATFKTIINNITCVFMWLFLYKQSHSIPQRDED